MVMDTWTLQMGYPVVTVVRDYTSSGKAAISQKRFLLGEPKEDEDHDYKWWIPLNYATPGGDFLNTDTKIWMSAEEKNKTVSGLPENDTPVIFNVQETGKDIAYLSAARLRLSDFVFSGRSGFSYPKNR